MTKIPVAEEISSVRLLKKSRLLCRKAPRNDKTRVFLVIASDPKGRAAISIVGA